MKYMWRKFNNIYFILFLTGKGSENGTHKLIAIVAGGIVATILLGVVYYFFKSCGKKDDGKIYRSSV